MSPEAGGPVSTGRLGWVKWIGAIVLAVLALHSLSYGGSFVADPIAGAREFGNDEPPSQAAERLAGLVGVVLLLLGLTAALAALLLLRGRPGGAWLTLGLGIATLSVGVYWALLGSSWDAGVYGGFGLLLTGASAVSIGAGRASSVEP